MTAVLPRQIRRFATVGVANTLIDLALFVASTGAMMWVLQPLLIDGLTGLGLQPTMLAKVVGLGGSVVANYLMYHHVVWRSSVSPEPLPEGLDAAPVAARR